MLTQFYVHAHGTPGWRCEPTPKNAEALYKYYEHGRAVSLLAGIPIFTQLQKKRFVFVGNKLKLAIPVHVHGIAV